MIFKLTKGVRELLALTPVIHEFKHRNPQVPIFVETDYPNLFVNNPDVQQSAINIDKHDSWIDLNLIDPNVNKHVIDVYANAVLGDARLHDRHIRFDGSQQDKTKALTYRERYGDKLVCMDYEAIESEYGKEAIEATKAMLDRHGYETLYFASHMRLEDAREMISLSSLFFGADSAMSYVAMATDTPMVMLFSNRNPRWNMPFRRGVEFQAIRSQCPEMDECVNKYWKKEFNQVYGVQCPKQFFCKNDMNKIIEGIELWKR